MAGDAGSLLEKPALVYDARRALVGLWVERWRAICGEAADFRACDDIAAAFPQLAGSPLVLIEPGGRTTTGAQAALRLLALCGERPAARWFCDVLPGFAALIEATFAFLLRHGAAIAFVVRLLWGRPPYRPCYRRMRAVLLRGLGLAYLVAFWSLGVQVDGLIGSAGILPVGQYLTELERALGHAAYSQSPTLLWLDSSDRFLHVLCWAGVATSVLVIAGVLPALGLVALWVFYLSLVVGGQDFLGFQWDSLLLEAGLLGILFAPWVGWLGWAKDEPPRSVVWLLRWLVFRLMLESGVVKLASGDATWHTWQALEFHYETQPLPAWTSWYVHQLPPWFQALSVGFMFYAELVAPFFVFGPRRIRLLGFWSMILLQLLIAATGNYGFFNLLAIVLCLSLLDDRDLGRKDFPGPRPGFWQALRALLLAPIVVVLTAVTAMEGLDRVWWPNPFPDSLEQLRQALAPLRSANAYGLFAVMTKKRPEIVVECSDDAVRWEPYRFRWKPQDPNARPRFTTPHMPRLDWQMWFAALALNCQREPWFLQFERRLLEASPPVLRLLEASPFGDRPPRYVRARLFLYHFTRSPARDWWQRDEVGMYCPPVTMGRPQAAGR